MRDASDRRVVGRVTGIDRPAYMHSFGMTDRYVVLHEGSLVVNPLKLALSGRPFIENFRWEPERGSRFWVIDRADGGRTLGPWTAPPSFCFHHVNCFEEDGELVVDLLAFEDAEIVWALGLARLRAGERTPYPRPAALPPAARGGRRRSSPCSLSDVPLRAPAHRVPDAPRPPLPLRVRGRARRPAAALLRAHRQGRRRDRGGPALAGAGDVPGRAGLRRRGPDAAAEDDGVLLSVVLEPDRNASSLLVLDASDLGELARAGVPHHIPFGFHGQHFRT